VIHQNVSLQFVGVANAMGDVLCIFYKKHTCVLVCFGRVELI